MNRISILLLLVVMTSFYILTMYKKITTQSTQGMWKLQNQGGVTNSRLKKSFLKPLERNTALSKLNLDMFCQRDKFQIGRVLEFNSDTASLASISKMLAQTVSYPIQTACQVMKRTGHGAWSSKCYDGHKYVCLDDIDPSNCLVYSFGIENEISFEQAMAAMGCEVYGYDIGNTYVMKTNTNPKLHFKVAQIGSGGKSKQLMDLLQENGHANKSITYFKADIEGEETPGIPIWIRSGALKNVQQLSFEFHSVEQFASQYWAIIQDLYRMGFRIISYDPNFCTTMSENGFYEFFEIVFRKTEICNE